MSIFLGNWNPADPPQSAGLAVNFRTLSAAPTQVDSLGVAAIVGVSDWGPANQIATVDSFSTADLLYRSGTDLNFAITGALTGEGTDQRSGARSVLAYRIVGSGAAAASVSLSNTTPASALSVAAKYPGLGGNALSVAVQANADTTKHDFLVMRGSTLLERYTYPKTDLAVLVSALAGSSYVTGSVVIDGVALATVAATPLASGTAGAAITVSEHAAAMAALEARAGEFSVLALDTTPTDSTIRATWRDWTKRVANDGGLFHWVIGGLAAEAPSTAIQRTGPIGTYTDAMDSEWIVNLTRDLIIGGVTYSSSKMAPRVAGIIAAAGVSRSASFATIAGATLANAPTSAEVELLVRGGVVPFVWSDSAAMLQRARTTFVTTSTDKNAKWKSLLNVRKIAYAVRAMAREQQAITGGDGVGNDSGPLRDAVIGRFRDVCEQLVAQNVLSPGTTVEMDDTLGLDNDNEVLHLRLVAKPVSGIETTLVSWTIPV